jgi:hypothetical protein
MNKKYPIKPNKKQLAIMKLYWGMFQAEQTIFWAKLGELERKMSKLTGINDLEFFFCDNECVGIGNIHKTMKLIHGEDL